jgi:hypothetical protein
LSLILLNVSSAALQDHTRRASSLGAPCSRARPMLADPGLFARSTAELLSSEKRQVGDTVYLGDSITDLPALMAADYGIVIRQSKKLRDILQAAGIAIAPLGGAPMRSRGPASVTGVLYTAEWCALEREAACRLKGIMWRVEEWTMFGILRRSSVLC